MLPHVMGVYCTTVFCVTAWYSDPNFDLNVPTFTRFNACRPDKDSRGRAINYSLYILALHEIGHALGLSNSGESLKYIDEYTADEIYVISHPTIADSVLNYDSKVSRAIVPNDFAEPDCSPHPFDVMAIYALYQNIP